MQNNLKIIDQVFYEKILLKIIRFEKFKKFRKNTEKSESRINFRQMKSSYHILKVHRNSNKKYG